MSAHSNLDREAFQTLLANAFLVQESGISRQSLSAVIELQKSIANHESFEAILAQIADRARTVADATGIAIGILTGDQLVYRAGSGSGATCVGQHLTAVLSLSGQGGARKEILRVDNADTDARIEAAICRDRPARALLILPIYHERVVAGVLEILFSDPHTFEDREIRTYRLLVGLVEEAMLSKIQRAEKGAQAAQSPTPAVRDPVEIHRPAIAQVCGTPAVSGVSSTLCPRAKNEKTIRWPAKLPLFYDSHWTVDAALVVIIVGLAVWISMHHRASPSIESATTLTAETPTPKPSATISPKRSESKQKAPGGAESASRSPFKRVRVGPNEVDYMAEDVTIRRFTAKAAVRHAPATNKQYDIGDDVTVHIFTDASAVSPKTRIVSRR